MAELFDIEAKATGPATTTQLRLVLVGLSRSTRARSPDRSHHRSFRLLRQFLRSRNTAPHCAAEAAAASGFRSLKNAVAAAT